MRVIEIVGHLALEVVERAAEGVFVFVFRAHYLLPLALAGALTSLARLHLDDQCAEVVVGFEQDEVGHAGQHALGFEAGAGDGVAASAVGHGEEAPPEVGASEGAFRRGLTSALASISSSVSLDFLMIVRLVNHHIFAPSGTDGDFLPVGNAVDEAFGGTLAS